MLTPIRTRISAGLLPHELEERGAIDVRALAHLRSMTMLEKITSAIAQRQDLQSIYMALVGNLEVLMPVEFAAILIYDSSDSTLSIRCLGAASQSFAAQAGLDDLGPILVKDNGLESCVHGELLHEPDLKNLALPFAQLLARAGINAAVIVPLCVEDSPLGVMLAGRKAIGSFSSTECEFLRLLGEHASLAARQAHLYQSLERAYDELRTTQEAVSQQERLRALGQMASGIAHDINNAMSPISLYAEGLLAHEKGMSEQGRKQLTIMVRAIDDVAATIARLRDFYRFRTLETGLTPVDLNKILFEVIELTRARWHDIAQRDGISISVDAQCAEALPAVFGVPGEIREALTNLIFNAIDAMPTGGAIQLRTALRSPETVCLEVVDTGVGMDEQTRNRCLEPFFTTKGERGTGLGLSMVYGFVRRHGAELEIDTAVGSGTTMRMLFPVSREARPVAPIPPAHTAPVRALRVLLVDDDSVVRHSVESALARAGHVVTAAAGGRAGIAAFDYAMNRGEAFDIVVTDFGMPDIDGSELARHVKRKSQKMPVVLLSGWGRSLANQGEKALPVDAILSKPPKLDELHATLVRLTTLG